jgi:hypothetical protein
MFSECVLVFNSSRDFHLLLILFQDAESKRKELEEHEKKLAKRQEEIYMREKVSAAD